MKGHIILLYLLYLYLLLYGLPQLFVFCFSKLEISSFPKSISAHVLDFLFCQKEMLPKLVPLGCYVDKKSSRLLNIKFASFSNTYNASDPFATVVRCAHVARDKDYEYFAVQNFGVCRTDVNIVDNYDTYGEALPEKCVGGVGASYTNFVYRLRPAVDGPNVCDTVPCQNGGLCVVHFSDPSRYYCECGDWFTGDNCQGWLAAKQYVVVPISFRLKIPNFVLTAYAFIVVIILYNRTFF